MTRDLTAIQKRVYAYLVSDKPLITHRQFANAVGLDQPQKLYPPLTALVMKGLLVPVDTELEP